MGYGFRAYNFRRQTDSTTFARLTRAPAFIEAEDALASNDFSPDHPIERPAVENFFGTARKIPGEMIGGSFFACRTLRSPAGLLKAGKVGNRINADGKL
jgi:hypothetical protein